MVDCVEYMKERKKTETDQWVKNFRGRACEAVLFPLSRKGVNTVRSEHISCIFTRDINVVLVTGSVNTMISAFSIRRS